VSKLLDTTPDSDPKIMLDYNVGYCKMIKL